MFRPDGVFSAVAGSEGHFLTGVGAHIGAIVVSLGLNARMFWLSFRLAVMRRVPWKELRLGVLIAAVIWTVLQLAGSYVIQHQLDAVRGGDRRSPRSQAVAAIAKV
jgi:uncharacterized BrkB/YihY/UPF0761 family membrane protein